MSPMPSFARHAVTVTEPGRRIVYGAPVSDWAPDKVTTRTIERCLVQPATAEESTKDPDTVRDVWNILIPGHETPPSDQAKVKHPFSATDYRVLGDPMPQPDTRGGIDHWFLACEKWSTNA